VVLVGFAGLVVDLGRMAVIKSELQNAADACALAAAQELDGAADALTRAQDAGTAVAALNRVNFQSSTLGNGQPDVRFSTALSDASGANGVYQLAGASQAGSTYVMCTARVPGVAMTLTSVLGSGPQTIEASAVAQARVRLPACALPFGLCRPPFGLSHDQWFHILGFVCGLLRQPPIPLDARLLDTLRAAMSSVCTGGRIEAVLVQ
jgi:Flp pilus assembly protein TadG